MRGREWEVDLGWNQLFLEERGCYSENGETELAEDFGGWKCVCPPRSFTGFQYFQQYPSGLPAITKKSEHSVVKIPFLPEERSYPCTVCHKVP